MKRRTAREKALQALFQIDMSETNPHEAIKNVLNDQEHDEFLQRLVEGTVEHLSDIDDLIRANLEKWTLERIGNVDRAILRLASYEINYEDDIPLNVSMDEAIELAKIFGDDDSSKFINAVLSKIKKTVGE